MKFRKLIWLAGIALPAIILSACTFGATPAPTEDPGAVQTQAFSIVSTQAALQQTQTAQALPPTSLPTNTPFPTPTLGGFPTFALLGGTNTPFAFNTQQPGFTPLASAVPTFGVISTVTTKNGCNDGQYIGETKPDDQTVIEAGKNFSKGWTINNTGECAWDEGYVFDYLQDYPGSTLELVGYDIVLKKNTPEDYTQPGYGQTFIVKLKAPSTPGEYKAYWKLKDETGNYFGPLVYVWIIVK